MDPLISDVHFNRAEGRCHRRLRKKRQDNCTPILSDEEVPLSCIRVDTMVEPGMHPLACTDIPHPSHIYSSCTLRQNNQEQEHNLRLWCTTPPHRSENTYP